MAATASSAPSLISTNAKPLDRPVSRSVMTSALVTVPYWEKAVTRSSLVVWNEMFPTYSFLLTIDPLGGPPGPSQNTKQGGRSSRPSRSPSDRDRPDTVHRL